MLLLAQTEIIAKLQLAVSPVILISGVGLLLLSITNRYGRVIDRVRVLSDALRRSNEGAPHIAQQLAILVRRAGLLRLSVTFGVLALICASLLIIGLFSVAEPGGVVVVTFLACLVSLIACLVVFLIDINASLAALKLDYHDATKGR